MQPEDIDKLFREKLAQHAPTPPAYLWNQLEDELQPTKKRPLLWICAAAASVLLLLVSGVVWLQNNGLQPASSGAIATAQSSAQRPQLATPEPAAPVENKNTVASTPQATTPPPAASSPSDATTGLVASSRPLQSPATSTRQPATTTARPRVVAPATQPASQAAQEAVAVQAPSPQPERPLEPVAPASQPLPALALAATPAPAPTGPIEVEVRRSTVPAVATAAQATPRQRSLGGVLLRQARNAVRGERLSLAEAGLPETVTVQAHVAGRTLTKVIQL
ncbi:hypothetical protein [Hymenobacter sp. BT190]|uniref:hypothetical protein n=1 Tax=Hymenobacter sp. BT190 TaxID=2763505 RepID=UPI001650E218|nr:hypothetical protein [Hymenobacter sp. BT190]MBC6699353.1 hypothetical protein [Hymenobacter sp. BT190]